MMAALFIFRCLSVAGAALLRPAVNSNEVMTKIFEMVSMQHCFADGI
jgi:hypothetical protein